MSVEAFLRNQRGTSNYEVSLQRVRQQAQSCDFRGSARRLGLNEQGGAVVFPLLGTPYRLELASCAVTRLLPDGKAADAGFYAPMILYDIFAFAPENEPASRDYVSIGSLCSVQSASSYAGAGMLAQTAQYFDAHTAEVAGRLSLLGAEPFGKGDIGCLVPLFRDISAAVSFWRGDDEFPPSLTLLFDRSILRYMHYETVWYAAMLLTDLCMEV